MATQLRLASTQGRLLLLAVVVASGMGFLDATVVNVALPRIGTELDASLAQLQWVLNAYLLALATLILVGGSLGDRFGRRRVFLIGVAWFALASALCGLAPGPGFLIAARGLQGIGAALLTPGSLALLQASLHPDDRAPAIGRWAGLAGVTTAIGPFLGGWLVGFASWRWVFLINLPLAALVLVVGHRCIPESRDTEASKTFDLVGAGSVAVGLGALTYAIIESTALGVWATTAIAAAGVAAMILFVTIERRHLEPMVPPTLFTSRVFSASNGLTFVAYGALGTLLLMLVLQLQVVLRWTPLEAGAATMPITVLMLLGSSRAARLAATVGPRGPMTVGPLVLATGVLLLVRVGAGSTYVRDVLPGVVLAGIGLTLMVAPLTSTVLAAAPDRYAGIASGVNNAVARTGTLLAVAAIPVAVGLTGDDYRRPGALDASFEAAMYVCAGMLVIGAVAAWFGLGSASSALRRQLQESA